MPVYPGAPKSPAYSSYRLRAVDRGPIELGRTIATLEIWSKG
jgi:hypothetical protein